ncbi:MAG: hypothetical protein WBP22_01065 [Candidatus Saccharimonas sp.]
MTTGYENPLRKDMLAEIARRPGTVEEWSGELAEQEPLWTIERRITDHHPVPQEEDGLLRQVIIAEQDRQRRLIGQWIASKRRLAEEQAFLRTWEPIAIYLTSALKHPDDPRSDGEVIAKTIEALRLVDRHVNAQIDRHDPFRPIG